MIGERGERMEIRVGDFKAEVLYSRRKTIGLTVYPDGRIVLRMPVGEPIESGCRFILEKQSWIRSKLQVGENRREGARAAGGYLSDAELQRLADEASAGLWQRIQRFLPIVGVTIGRVTIRCQKTRWGRCSSAGNINLNCLLMLTPPKIRDYVVVHELCHRLEMNHSARFWKEVARVLPDYRESVAWLKRNGSAIIGRVRR